MMKLRTRFLLSIVSIGIVFVGVEYAVEKIKTNSSTQTPQVVDFSFEKLQTRAKELAQKDYTPSKIIDNIKLSNLDYDQYRDIRFNQNEKIFKKSNNFNMQLFHIGGLFKSHVKLYLLNKNKAELITYNDKYFDFGKNNLSDDDKKDGGYAGFRLHYPLNSLKVKDELISFLGASYFRALGFGHKYGISSRGLAIDTATMKGEEFPSFTEFYIEEPKRNAKTIKVYALLESKSLTGAYSFTIKPGKSTIIDVDSVLYFREKVEKLGIAPLTSMFLYGENNRYSFDDYRPEVHDSDGLLSLNQKGEWLWRPLDNAKYLRISSFMDENPKGFGLMQRDRNVDHYLDFEANYHERPSVWIEPLNNWGKGVVQLVEIPSKSEVNDNVVAYFVPNEEIKLDTKYQYQYRLYFSNDVPENKTTLAKIIATYTGTGGVSGVIGNTSRKFVVEFSSPNLRRMFGNNELELDVSSTEGKIENSYIKYNTSSKGVVAYMDYIPNGKTSELRIALREKSTKNIISEIWTYQYLP